MLQYSSIGNVVKKYYNVTYVDVNWTAIMSCVSEIIFFYPIAKFIDYYGIRNSMLLATFFLTFGGCLKLMAVNRDLFWLLLVGQIFPRTIWFKTEEAALVMGIANGFFMLGADTDFVLPIIFKNSTAVQTKAKFFYIAIIITVSCAILFLLTLLYVVDKPPSHPSQAANNRESNGHHSLRVLLKNKNFILLTICFSLIVGSAQSFAVTLNQAVLKTFSNDQNALSIAGILAISCGIPGSLISSLIAKKYSNYRYMDSIEMVALFIHCRNWLFNECVFCVDA
ncbi:hypothetical protein B4U79_17973 [Dinothrombium tinctorium]|uniref:Uncharacterized protein n=1 Tax=Dinothrombium tinctorium TaxID=1965070 RepID=A0A3S3PIR4_9ACAR|nr:hypothetical protein B4U79_17973 [Dinothrombium tinctorium]